MCICRKAKEDGVSFRNGATAERERGPKTNTSLGVMSLSRNMSSQDMSQMSEEVGMLVNWLSTAMELKTGRA